MERRQYLTGSNPMSDVDLEAVAAYLKTIPPIEHDVAKTTFKATPWIARGDPGTDVGSAPITAQR